MRDVVISLIILGLLPSCFKRPFVGLVVFSWLAYMRVQDLTWGFAKQVRWSFYVAIVMGLGFLFSKERRMFIINARTLIMIALVILVFIGIQLSHDPTPRQFSRYVEFVKIIGIGLFTTAVVTNKERLRVLVWVIAISLGFYGVKSGIWGIFTLGRTPILRGPGGMLQDNNDLSLALAMAVPMLFHLGWTERREVLRKAFWFMLPLTVITVGLTHSRGGFLSVSVAILMLVWRSRNRFMGIAVGLLVAMAAFVLAPDSYKERLNTMRDYQSEGSAASRVRAWGIATRMALDNPFFGVGFNKFRQHYLQYCLDPTPKEKEGKGIIVAHSSYFQIWAEAGTPAILLYLSLIFFSFVTCWKIRRMAKRRYFSSWMINYATMFEASLATFMVGATFLNRAHFDLFYHWVAMIIVFDRVAMREMRDEVAYPIKPTTGRGRGPIRHVRENGFEPRPRPSGFQKDAVPGGV